MAIAGLELHPLPLMEENQFLPDLTAIPAEVARQARVMILSYPNNPTAAVAPASFFRQAIEFCTANDIFLIHDFPYVDMDYGDYEAPSMLAQPGALDIAIELERIALSDEYFVKRQLYPNVDFYSGIIYRCDGLPGGDVHRAVRGGAHGRVDRRSGTR